MVFGAFDGPEESYTAFFEEARTHGNYLIAVVPQDHLIEHMSGELPTLDLSERFDNLQKHNGVNEIIIDNADTSIREIVEAQHPDVLAFGSDQETLKEEIEAQLGYPEGPMEIKVLEHCEINI